MKINPTVAKPSLNFNDRLANRQTSFALCLQMLILWQNTLSVHMFELDVIALPHIDSLMQYCGNSGALAMEILRLALSHRYVLVGQNAYGRCFGNL